MRTIINVRNQKEMDSLPSYFDKETFIEIRSEEHEIVVRKKYTNAKILAYSSTVYAHRDSIVSAHCSSRVVAYEDSKVVAFDNSIVESFGNSKVSAFGNSKVEAFGNSTVSAYNSSIVEAFDSSRVEAFDNSKVSAFDNSKVVAFDSSEVEAFLCSEVCVYSSRVSVLCAFDNAHILYKTKVGMLPDKVDETAIVTEFKDIVKPTFEQWLERGYVLADGLHQKLVSQKTFGDISIFTGLLGSENSFVAKKGTKFAHGRTIEEAIKDLRYKISDRDKSKYESWSIEESYPVEDMIEAYMTITGACSFGTKQFCESVKLKKAYTPKEIIELTTGKYGNAEFSEFFN